MACTITPRVVTGADEYNNEIIGDGTPIIHKGGAGDGVWIEQQQRFESGDSDNVQTEQWRLFAPAADVFDAGAKVEVDGGEYEVVGPPWRATNPRQQSVSHVEATLKRTQ